MNRPRAAGRGRGRGRGTDRGRGRGGRGRGRGRGGAPDVEAQILQELYGGYAPNTPSQGNYGKTKRGLGSPSNSFAAASPPRGRGAGRGRGKTNGFGSLSTLLYEDRPLLRPVLFVPSQMAPVLFQEKEDLLKPVIEDVDDTEESHLPTANKVLRVFSGANHHKPPPSVHGDDLQLYSDEEELEEIDFNDLPTFHQKVDALPPTNLRRGSPAGAEVFTGIISTQTESDDQFMEEVVTIQSEATISESTPSAPAVEPIENTVVAMSNSPIHTHDTDPSPSPETDEALTQTNVVASIPPPEIISETPLFFFDSTPAPISLSEPSQSAVAPLGTAAPDDDDDEIIVFEAPLPRSQAPTTPARTLPSFSFTPSPTKRQFHPGRSATKDQLLERRRARRRSFADRAADVAEAQLYGEPRQDPRFEDRRRGDSDVDWGDSDVEAKADAEGMDVDPELELDDEAMRRFAKSMSGEWKTMEDMEDEERMRVEDAEEDEASSGSSSSEDDEEEEAEVRRAIELEENNMVANSDEDEDDYTPNTSFQMRLQSLRLEPKKGGKPMTDDDDEDDFALNRSWAEQDDDFIAHLEELVDRASAEDRGGKKRLFRSIQNGAFDDSDEEWSNTQPARRRKDKWKDIPSALQAQWETDRQKKAKRKQERELARLMQAADPLAEKKGGKKGKKAMLIAAKLDPTIMVIPNRIIDPTTLVQQMRRFIADREGSNNMSLPPTNKETRKNVHELAMAFQLKSVSKGKGDARYTTLIKTTYTGEGRVDEKKVAKVMRIMGARGGSGGDWGDWSGSKGGGKGRNGGGGGHMPRHKEGDEVGKEAPKIGEGNVGFRMLALMGWAEGTHIGVAEDRALKNPLTAVIKNTKLGLGATK